MTLYEKSYNTASGYLQFKFKYDDSLAGAFSDFSITKVGDLERGFDSGDSNEISIYPSSIIIDADKLNGNDYSKIKQILKAYPKKYPLNYDEFMSLEILLNGQRKFKGIVEGLDDDYDDDFTSYTFIDGVNKLKDLSIAQPAVLEYLYNAGILPGSDTNRVGCRAYGFANLRATARGGYEIDGLEFGERDTRLSETIIKLFKTVTSGNIDFQNEFLFGDTDTAFSDLVNIDQVNIRRICSHLMGRYVAIDKQSPDPVHVNEVMVDGGNNQEYSKAKYFELVYEDDTHKTYWHNWEGTYPELISSKVYRKGANERAVSDMLKLLARNLFSYFGFKQNGDVYFRHKRFTSQPVPLTGINSMKKNLTLDKITSVKIKDTYTSNYATRGLINDLPGSRIKQFDIPLNAIRTEIAYEYRLNYYVAGNEKRVIHFYDKQTGRRDLPMDVIAEAEYNALKDHRDEYEIDVDGLDVEMDKTYSVNYDTYDGSMRPVQFSEKLLDDKTIITAVEL